MKRSNRLVLLIGVFLAVIAFIGIILLGNGGGTPGPDSSELPKVNVVVARVPIPLGVAVTAAMVTLKEIEVTEVTGAPAGSFAEIALVEGKIARRDINASQTLNEIDFVDRLGIIDIKVPPGLRAIAIQVDQVSGVGTVIQAGDIVDMLVGFSADKFPVVTVNPDDSSITVVAGLNSTSVKLLVQGMQVLGTLLPPPPVDANGQPIVSDGTNLTGQQEIVIVAATPQQVEIIKFAQLDGSISLVLRSLEDFERDPETNQLLPRIPDATTGVILKTLVDEHGVLIPQILETILPAQRGQ